MTTDSAHDLPSLANVRAPVDLNRVYREHAAQVSRWVRRLTAASDPSDTIQEVFEVAQRRLDSFRGDAQITTWLYSITVRVVSGQRRRQRLRRFLLLNFANEPSVSPEPLDTPHDNIARQHATRVVYGVLDRLSERDRTLLILFELDRVSTQDIASILNVSENSVSVGLYRARERFRALLRKHFPEEAEGLDHGQSTP